MRLSEVRNMCLNMMMDDTLFIKYQKEQLSRMVLVIPFLVTRLFMVKHRRIPVVFMCEVDMWKVFPFLISLRMHVSQGMGGHVACMFKGITKLSSVVRHCAPPPLTDLSSTLTLYHSIWGDE